TADTYQSKPYAHAAARRALSAAISRRGMRARVEDGLDVSSFRVHYEVPAKARVSIVVPTRDRVGLLRTCISSIQRTTDLQSIELVIVNNASVESETYAYFRDLDRLPYVRVVDYHAPFNYSKINNFGVKEATGDYLLFLNNDTEAEAEGWLDAMLEHAQRP